MQFYILASCFLAGALFVTLVYALDRRSAARDAEEKLFRREVAYQHLLDLLPDPEPWQQSRREQPAAHQAAEPAGYRYSPEGRDGTEA